MAACGWSLSTGPGTYAAPQKITMAQSYQCHFSRADVGDVNGDGKKDIVLAYGGDSGCSGGTIPSGVLSMMSNGDGTFTQVFYRNRFLGILAAADRL